MELQAAVFEHIQEREDLAEPIRRRVGELNVHLGMDVLPQAPEEATVEEAPESAPVRIDSYFRRGVQAWDGGKRKRSNALSGSFPYATYSSRITFPELCSFNQSTGSITSFPASRASSSLVYKSSVRQVSGRIYVPLPSLPISPSICEMARLFHADHARGEIHHDPVAEEEHSWPVVARLGVEEEFDVDG
ncbi:hypothetical protein BDV98DRAFT_608540 [Pterulicium gracile]|uniref:Uncharacterized protein n=1 Tax=Pterulicium gracile TaxID=1884261 RepID=A0A5C3Q273_9AGAR|nr:hypothetical protein BDV98DRAFT_608540 [Pterula gracilis]